jgi:ribosomal protein L37AE/L43A
LTDAIRRWIVGRVSGRKILLEIRVRACRAPDKAIEEDNTMSIGQNRSWQLRHRARTSETMREFAKNRQCPQCLRKSAIKRIVDGDYVERRCRWCGWAKGSFLDSRE